MRIHANVITLRIARKPDKSVVVEDFPTPLGMIIFTKDRGRVNCEFMACLDSRGVGWKKVVN